jgi:DNA-binding NarL/FixJ family response regulator
VAEIPRPAAKPSPNLPPTNDDRSDPAVRVLVVDDYKEFRELVCEMLGKRQNLHVVGEASDGKEAVSKAVELKPDLILLDIDLPRLNGIAAARQILEFVPESKIVFLSAGSSADVVRRALSVGWGYVHKTNIGSDLLAAVDSVLLGAHFVSRDLWGDPHSPEHEGFPSLAQKSGEIARSHEAQFYSDEGACFGGLARFVEKALRAGNPTIVIATESHRNSLLQTLQEHGVNGAAAIEQGRYIPLDVAETLSSFMVNDLPDPVRFSEVAGNLLATAAKAATGKHSRVAACGEGTAILWAQGKADAAIRLEQLWDEIAKTCNVDILCVYALNSFQREQESHIYQRICAAHSAVSLR